LTGPPECRAFGGNYARILWIVSIFAFHLKSNMNLETEIKNQRLDRIIDLAA